MSSRPLSPHLQIYRPQLTSLLSITHRISGLFLSLGTIALTAWLVALARGPAAYAQATGCLGSWWVQLVLFAWTWAFFYHLCNGIRHLFWDAGQGFELKTAYMSGFTALGAATFLTVVTWICVLAQGGGA